MEKKSLIIDLIIFLPKESFPLPLSKDMQKCEFPESESRSGKNEVHSYLLYFLKHQGKTGINFSQYTMVHTFTTTRLLPLKAIN